MTPTAEEALEVAHDQIVSLMDELNTLRAQLALERHRRLSAERIFIAVAHARGLVVNGRVRESDLLGVDELLNDHARFMREQIGSDRFTLLSTEGMDQ